MTGRGVTLKMDLKALHVQLHHYTLEEDKLIRAVILALPVNTNKEKIKQELELQRVAALAVCAMSRRGGPRKKI